MTGEERSWGRQLQVAVTDDMSARRTPAARLNLVPAAARRSFLPLVAAMPRLAPGEHDLTRRTPTSGRAEGTAISVSGRVIDIAGRPQRGVLIEIWNANAKGRYDHPDDPGRMPLDPLFGGFGRVMTDDAGRYMFLTIRPAPYLARPDIGRWRPAHVHLSLIGGATRLVTQMYFPGDPLQAGDPSFRLLGDAARRQIARPIDVRATDVAEAYEFDIVVSGAMP